MAKRTMRLCATDITRRGERWYNRLKSKLEPKLNGKVIVIAVDTGLYVLGEDIWETDRLFDRLVGKGVRSYGRKIGPDPYTVRLGA